MLVVKRNGSKEPLQIEKITEVLKWACEGLHNVSVSDVEMSSKIQFYDCMPTTEIHQIMIKTAADLISLEFPDYQFVAGRLAMFNLRKEVYNRFEPFHLQMVIEIGVKAGLYSKELLTMYSEHEWDIINGFINHDLDFNYTYAATCLWLDKYLVQNRKTKKIIETPQIANVLIAAVGFHNYPDSIKLDKVREFYNSLSQSYISLPTPIMAGLRTNVKQFSSCCVMASDDTLQSIQATSNNVIAYSAKRAGIGIDLGRIRAVNSIIRDGDAISTGVVPFTRLMQSALKSCSQGALRGASATVYFPIWHKEIEDILVLKNNKGADDNRVRFVDYGIGWSQFFIKKALTNEDMHLFCPSDVPELYDAFYARNSYLFEVLYDKYSADKSIDKKTVKAFDILKLFLLERQETGRIYPFFADEVARRSQFSRDLVTQSNLCCFSGNTLIAVADGRNAVKIKDLVEQGELFQVYTAEYVNSAWLTKVANAVAFKSGRRLVCEYTLDNGDTFKCTSEHSLAEQTGNWKSARSLSVDRIGLHTLNYNSQAMKIVGEQIIGEDDVYDLLVEDFKCYYIHTNSKISRGILAHNCEITLPTVPDSEPGLENGLVSLCTLAAINVGKFEDYTKMESHLDLLVRFLDDILDYQDYPIRSSRRAVELYRPLGIGIVNLAYKQAKLKSTGKNLLLDAHQLGECLYYYSLKSSVSLAKEKGVCMGYNNITYHKGLLNIDTYNKNVDSLAQVELQLDWEALRKEVNIHGVRNATLLALMPSENSSIISNATNGIDPVINLITVKQNKGFTAKQVVPQIHKLKNHYKSVWNWTIEEQIANHLSVMAVLQKFVCQAISTNTYINPSLFADNKVPLEVLMQLFLFATKHGLKTLYYAKTNKTEVQNEEVVDDCIDSCKI